MRRVTIVAGLIILMAAFGLGVNRFLASTKRIDRVNDSSVSRPTEAQARFALSQPVYLAQRGQLFRLADRGFTAVSAVASGQWMQPAAAGGRLVAVLRSAQSSDLYQLDPAGKVIRRLTHDDAGATPSSHWVFWPHLTDQGKVFVSYDAPKSGYDVDLAVWSGTVGGQVASQRWTTPNPYTGGDVDAAPLATGGIVFSRYEIAGGKVYSRVVVQSRPLAAPVYLTAREDDCGQAAPSPDGTEVAMICTSAQQSTRLVVAHLGSGGVSSQHVVVQGCLCASPSWSPDGRGIAYIAPGGDVGGHFQLWWVEGPDEQSSEPRQVTDNLDLDATSAPAWEDSTASPPG